MPKIAHSASRVTNGSAPSTSSQCWLIIAIFLVAINLRPTITSVGPILDSMRLSLQMSGSAIGLLLTLPVLCFGAFAPFAPRLLRHHSAERIILAGLAVLAAGIGLRSLFGTAGLFAGTLVASASISVIMVLLPSIIKQHFSRQAGLMMGLYSMALVLGAALAAGTTVPLESIPGSNWRWALAFWLLPALLAARVWWPQLSRAVKPQSATRPQLPRLRNNRLAWQVTLYMGLQSALAYCVIGWLPAILIDRGLTPLLAGFVLSLSLVMQLVTSLSGPWLATRGRDQRFTIVIMLLMALIGLMGCLYGPVDMIWPWVIILGLGQGGTFSIALALLVLRAPDSRASAALSGMAQGVGYSIAALGPFVVGLLHEYSGNWHGVAAFFVIVTLAALVAGLGAGRALYINVDAASSM